MIKDPQIFIVYETGMMGTFFCNLFMFQEKLINNQVMNMSWKGDDKNSYNTHGTLYRDTLKNFHGPQHFEKIKDKELTSFFAPLENKGISIHRLTTWKYLSLDYSKYFSNYVIGLIMPSEDNCSAWAERSVQTTDTTRVKTEWWYKNIRDITKVPKAFINGMRIKERKKYLQSHYEIMKNIKMPDHIVHFDLDCIEIETIQEFCDQCCKAVGINCFDLPHDLVSQFLEKNKMFFDKLPR
jgi:hypothetical protein